MHINSDIPPIKPTKDIEEDYATRKKEAISFIKASTYYARGLEKNEDLVTNVITKLHACESTQDPNGGAALRTRKINYTNWEILNLKKQRNSYSKMYKGRMEQQKSLGEPRYENPFWKKEEQRENAALIEKCLSPLDPRAKDIIKDYYQNGLTLQEVINKHGTSLYYVNKYMEQIKNYITESQIKWDR